MAEVTVDEIIEVCSQVTHRMVQYLEFFFCSIKELENEYMSGDVLNSNDITNCSSDTQLWIKDFVDDVTGSISKNTNCLDTLKAEKEQVKELQVSIQKKVAKNEKTIKLLKGKISNINKKKSKLMDNRDEVQICKLLTNTTFVYERSNVSGYVIGPITKQIDHFEFHLETVSEQNIAYIINNLYNIVKKVSNNA